MEGEITSERIPWATSTNTSLSWAQRLNNVKKIAEGGKHKSFGKFISDANDFLTGSNGGFSGYGSMISKGLDVVGGLINDPSGYQGKYGTLQRGIDSTYNSISNAVMAVPGWGTVAGLGMKALGVLNKGIQRLGGGTDGMTKTDAWLNSSFLGWTPLGLINGFGGKKADSYTRDLKLDAQSGSGFSGFLALQNTTLQGAGKKYGLFSSGAREKLNNLTEYTLGVKHTISGIVDFNTLNNLAVQGTTPFTLQQQNLELTGGIHTLRAAAKGGKLRQSGKSSKKPFKFKIKSFDDSVYKLITLGPDWREAYVNGYRVGIRKDLTPGQYKGDPIATKDGDIVYMKPDGTLSTTPTKYLFAKLGAKFARAAVNRYKLGKDINRKKDRSISELLDYVKNLEHKPEFIKRMEKNPVTVEFFDTRHPEKGVLYGTHYMAYENNRVYPTIFPIDGRMIYIDDPAEAYEYAEKTGNYIEFNSPTEAKLFSEYYKQGWPDFFKAFDDQFDESLEISFFKSGGKTLYIGVKEASTGQTIGIPYNITKELKNGYEPIKTNLGREVIMLRDGTVMYVEAARQMRPFLKMGGKMNVIPEGALHARKNHLAEVDDIFKQATHKGIPVITVENGELIQHAEVEHSEIIFTKEVTDKIELYRKLGTDEAALACGKLLVLEILYNTDDRTGLIQTIL